MNLHVLAAAVVLAVITSGCLPPPAPPPDGSPPNGAAPGDACSAYDRPVIDDEAAGFSGENAFAYVLEVVCDFSGDRAAPQYRLPGTPGQATAAETLRATLAAHGWSASFQNFTGAQYAAIEDKDGGQFYFDDPSYCTTEKRERLMDLPFANVVGELAGTSDDLVLLMAHYDSKYEADRDPDPGKRSEPVLGANDGASGVGVILEAARVLARSPQPADVRILFTDGEDGFHDCHPLAGSIWHAEHLAPADADRIIGILLLDMVGNANDTMVLTGNSTRLRDVLVQAGEEVDAPAITTARQAGPQYVIDDHTPFMTKGLPAVDVIPENFGGTEYWHTTKDTPDRLSPDRLAEVGRVTVRFVQLLPAAS